MDRVLSGGLSGVIPGLFFHNNDWLGGYASWPRRLIRFAHVAFFGIGFLNLAFALTARIFCLETGIQATSLLLLVGAVAMPAVCYLDLTRKAFLTTKDTKLTKEFDKNRNNYIVSFVFLRVLRDLRGEHLVF